ncbi:MAG: NAD(P)-dependent oxidoreductase [Nitrosopumilus sp.]|nr:NAD(P)-dependent oxidoreductase [Nitrosopumilus sp.]MDA7958850.1 NAD(P)-dependent oxidoreductase [Nitrosopumilus sp.]
MRAAIVGTGMLGGAVAIRLLQRGHDVSVYNRTPAGADAAVAAGARRAGTPAGAARGSDVVLVAVRDAAAVRDVAFGESGIAAGAGGAVVADLSTISPAESREVTARLAGLGVRRIDAPVMGGPDAAAEGRLVVMASGDMGAVDVCEPLLADVSTRVFRLGGPGDACAIKLAMNMQITMLALGLAEGINLVDRSGLDPGLFLEVLNSTYFATGMSRGKAYRMAGGGQDPTFTLANLSKDIETMLRAGREAGAAMPTTASAAGTYAGAVGAGLGGLDYTGIIRHVSGGRLPRGPPGDRAARETSK